MRIFLLVCFAASVAAGVAAAFVEPGILAQTFGALCATGLLICTILGFIQLAATISPDRGAEQRWAEQGWPAPMRRETRRPAGERPFRKAA